MPCYTYTCPKGHTHALWVGYDILIPTKAKCPHCGEQAKRIFKAPAIKFNGGGFTQKRRV